MLDWLLVHGSLIAVCILANSFFVAAEFALVSVRETHVQQLVTRNRPAARTTLRLKRNIDEVLPAVQLGVTLANLALGGLGEPALAAGVESLLRRMPRQFIAGGWMGAHPTAVAHTAAIPLAFGLITYLEVVLGEIVPKSLALQRAERIALAVAGPVDLFIRASRPVVRLLNGSASLALKVFRAPLRGEAGAHSPEELKLMTSEVRKLGLLPVYQEEIVHRALELRDVSASEIMTPRTRIFSLPVDMALEVASARIVEEEHSRVPVYDPARGREAFVGVVYAKDVFRLMHFRGVALSMGHRGASGLTLREVMREVLVVPETKPALELLQEFQERRRQLAIVVDEFGSTLGLVTAEDALEQIVGELEDEFDTGKSLGAGARGGVVVLDGSVTLRDLATQLRWKMPRTVGVETLAGLMLARFGHIPAEGEVVEIDGRRFAIVTMDRHRIARVRVEDIAVTAPPGEGVLPAGRGAAAGAPS